MIWIRADANKEIGSGHIMRCLSIAAALKNKGSRVCFIVADEGAKVLLEERGQDYRVLHTAYNDMEAELEQLLALLEEDKPELVLLDSYYVTEKYLSCLRQHVKTAYLDDIPRFAYPVDMVINYNIYGDCLPYREQSVDERQQFLLGASYAPLREQFRNIAYEVRPRVENVLITTGGSDKYNLAGQILEAVAVQEETKALHYHVVSGAFNPHYDWLAGMAEQNPNIHLYRNVQDMAALMRKCDIAITAGGSTMYELSAVGVPILCFSFVDNQEQIVETFYKKNLVAYGGNFLKEGEQFAGNVAEALKKLSGDEVLRRSYSAKQRQLVDGRGAERIAEEVLEMSKED